RPNVLQSLLPRLLELRATTARPHWLVIDEAHHLVPPSWQPSEAMLKARFDNVVLVTVHPDHVARSALDVIDTLIVVGREGQRTVDGFMRARGIGGVHLPSHPSDETLFPWFIRIGQPPVRFSAHKPSVDRQRHRRKYAEGELAEDRSFYFRVRQGG